MPATLALIFFSVKWRTAFTPTLWARRFEPRPWRQREFAFGQFSGGGFQVKRANCFNREGTAPTGDGRLTRLEGQRITGNPSKSTSI